MNGNIANKLIVLTLFGLIFLSFSCRRCSDRNSQTEKRTIVKEKDDHRIGKVIFYLENSESMFGYVNGFTEYVDVVSELSEKPEFVTSNAKREFYFINGGNQLSIINLGNDPAILKSKLNMAGFNCGDITKSNLNSMFQVVLEKAQNDTLAILISDAIYDIGQPQSPFNALVTEGRETRSKFITRLEDVDLQTLMIKLISNFNGNYFYSSLRSEPLHINQYRPFYIWIFGETELLNKYFPEEYISRNLKGYQNYARFLIIDEGAIPYRIITSIDTKGTCKLDRKIKNKLTNVEPDRHGQGFQFSIAVDYSSLPFSDSSLTSTANYTCNMNYKIMKVERIKSNQKYEVKAFLNPTHIITVYTDKNPLGNLEIVLKNEIPSWIKETHIDNENQIDNTQTFGFMFLTDAISQAYTNKNKGKNLATFKIEISK